MAPGLYLALDEVDADLDLLEIAKRVPAATICLTSALVRHELIDEIPSAIDVAIPRGTNPPKSSAPIRWHVFNPQTFDVGRTMAPIDGTTGALIGLYSAERSIVDAFRLRSTVGYEVATEALRTWIGRRGSQPAKLLEISQRIPRSKGPLLKALDVLL